MPFQIIRNDITKVEADAIVNSANPLPIAGNGTDGAIYKAAGHDELLAERKKIGPMERGNIAVVVRMGTFEGYIISQADYFSTKRAARLGEKTSFL